MVFRVALALALAALVASIAGRMRALTTGGEIAATGVGAAVYLAGGLRWGLILVLFFVSSSLLSRVRSAPMRTTYSEADKTDRRDALQVLANGGPAAAFCLLSLSPPSVPWFAAFAGSIAAATADTWATEIGKWSRRSPIRLISGEAVTPGTSGGVTPLGVAAGGAGALVITTASAALMRITPPLALAVAISGFAGSLIDSLLGATWQEVRYCPVCAKETEQTVHRQCSSRTDVVRGIAGFNNDAVNAVSCTCAGLLSLLIAHLVGR